MRRPRPRAYIELRETGSVSSDTQEALSFYSLHTALAASLASTATYLAFTRAGPPAERWLVLVPHLHRVSPVKIAASIDGDGGTLGVHGTF